MFSFILLIFGLSLYLPFISGKEFQGEEGRRVLIALQMLESGNFLFPHLFSEPYFNKPPLYNWILALGFYIVGDYSEFTARTISALSLILCSIFMFLLWVKIWQNIDEALFTQKSSIFFLLLPGFIFLTLPEVIDKALRAEIDGYYTLLITLSIFLWFYFHELKSKKKVAFLISGFFIGLAVLTKTFHAIVFLYLAIIPYLLMEKRLKELLGLNHLLGLLTVFIVFLMWALPVSMEIGISPFLKAWLQEYLHATKGEAMPLSQHLESFTISALLGYSPWIFFLISLGDIRFKSFLRENPIIKRLFLFSIIFFLSSYLFHFLFPGARLRYALPAIGGLVYSVSICILFLLVKGISFKTLSYLTKSIALFFLIFSVSFYFYLNKKNLELDFFFYLLLFLLLLINMFFLLRPVNLKTFIVYLIAIVFIVKHLYTTFYYPLHQREMNYYRKASFEIVKLIEPTRELYLCKVIPHHMIYYLKYRYRLVENIHYLKSCEVLPTNSVVLMLEKELNEQIISKYKINTIIIRNKKYVLLFT
ncbi:MAG: glycosyltransferase family 39 protein [Caldimicrobium sp.]|nr:glycosyltransferase family 39 protein [Caldimicrobium sp.]